MNDVRTHPNALDWARYFSGEVRWLAGWRFRRHLSACASCRHLEADMAQERAAFDASPLRREELALLQARLVTSPARAIPKKLPQLPWAITAGIAAVAIVLVVVRAPPQPPTLVEKGRDAFTMYVDRPSGAVALGSRCAAGDRVIARYRTERRYLLVLERDGSGAVQVLHPRDGVASAQLSAAEGTTPTSWILDAAAGQECFAAFFSDEPVETNLASQAFATSPTAPIVPRATVRVQCCNKEPSR